MYNTLQVTWTDSEKNHFAQFVYNSYSEKDYQKMSKEYDYYGNPGFVKPNLTKYANPESRQWLPKLRTLYKQSGNTIYMYGFVF